MKNEKTKSHSAAFRKKQIQTWSIRIFAILLAVFMLAGTFYYTIASLLG